MSKERSDAAKRPLDRRVRARDFAKWSTVILRPTFWWRVKSLFVAPEITFCWGEDEYTVRGLDGAEFLSIGGVPDSVRSNAALTGRAAVRWNEKLEHTDEGVTMFKKKYPSLSFAENFLGGHLTVGPVTIYGENAMHWAVNIRLRGGWLCFRLPLRCFGGWWPLYCYWSPNGTPTQATWWGWGRKVRGF